MNTHQLLRTLKRLPATAHIYGQFYLKDAESVLLPLGGLRPAKATEKNRLENPTDHPALIIYAKGEKERPMNLEDLKGTLKRNPATAPVCGQFYLQDAQAALLPVGGVRPARPLRRSASKSQLTKPAWVIYAEDDPGDY